MRIIRKHRVEKLRVLDGLEEYFWLSENTLPRTTMILAEVEGATTVEAWRDALSMVQRRYPLLSARICKNPGTPNLGRFLREFGELVEKKGRDRALQRLHEISSRYGYWNASPEENAAVGIPSHT